MPTKTEFDGSTGRTDATSKVGFTTGVWATAMVHQNVTRQRICRIRPCYRRSGRIRGTHSGNEVAPRAIVDSGLGRSRPSLRLPRDRLTPVLGATTSAKLIQTILNLENLKNIRGLRPLHQRT